MNRDFPYVEYGAVWTEPDDSGTGAIGTTLPEGLGEVIELLVTRIERLESLLSGSMSSSTDGNKSDDDA